MSDLDLSRGANSNQKRDAGSPKNLKDQMTEAGATVKQRAGEAFQATADVAQDKFKEAGDAAKDLASGTMDQIRGQAREQQRSGAEFIERLAGNVREAARAFESDVPIAARGINSAADYVEDAAEKIRNGSFRDLLDGATDFAKRQPAAFLGVSVLAGFAAVRFLKASGGDSPSSRPGMKSGTSSTQDEAWRGTTSSTGAGHASTQDSSVSGNNPQGTTSFKGGSVS
ncbi:gas vesicle protein [Bradyrhizobium sp. F1.13.3]